ncbi:transforming growth factor beta regulator 1 [Phytophthora ramorum]
MAGSSLVTRTRADHARSASPGRPFRVGSDGLPLLPCHDADARVVCASPAPPRAVSQFGLVDSKEDVRGQLLARYGRQPVSEMTLRIDTELELLRRGCFAQRNAQWGNAMPEQFEFRPAGSDAWTPQPANDKLLLRKMKMDGVLDGREFYPPDKSQGELDTVEFVRDRPWPPQEFALKPVTKPRGRGGKRKAAPMAAVLDPVPLLAKTCKECRTQSTPLWRTQTRMVKVKKQVAINAAAAAASLANAFVAQGMAKIEPMQVKMQEVEEKIEVDLCLQCYLKLERADLFSKKRVEKKRQERRNKEQPAAAALLEKKRLKHQIHLLKKQQKEHKKQDMLAATGEQAAGQVMEDDKAGPAAVILKFTREEIEAATGGKERKKDRKHSRKDKKKKKKHRRKRELMDDSESDGPTPIPSPAQMNGYVYADRAPEPYSTPQNSAFQAKEADSLGHLAVDTEPEALDSSFDSHAFKEEDSASTPSRYSSRKRKSLQRTEQVIAVESPASSSKKRKMSSSRSKRAAASAAPAPVVVAVPPTPLARKRSRTKKELARERELRTLGQYCPVCNEVYEDDDQNTFVCCDSCELWVHGACDPTLTPELIAAMANTEDKYICPLCAGR